MSNRVLVKHYKNWGLDEKKVVSLAKKVMKEGGLDRSELSLLFCGRRRAKKLNMEYRQMAYVPQILSFALKSDREKDGLRCLGDMVICNEKLKYEAVFLKSGIYQVLLDWLRHGMEALVD